ncbi:hypothetical protein JHK82_042951 [Glycine max]|nr:hypothetical protein JHK82_042951 [Glycine max]
MNGSALTVAFSVVAVVAALANPNTRSNFIPKIPLFTLNSELCLVNFGGGENEFYCEQKLGYNFKDDDQESIVMPDKTGQKYICYLPKVEKEKSGKPVIQHNISSMIVETEKRIKQKTPDELLEVLRGPCFLRQEGWWSYEFCYQKKLRQLHLEDDKVVQEFVLGVYDPEATAAFNENLSDISTLKDPRSKDASQRYHAHQYTNGTVCDLTNKPRETEVRFVCSEPRAMISSITEISTCKYALTVQCPQLCKHPLFQEERPVWHTIDCNVLPKDHVDAKVRRQNENTEIVIVKDFENSDLESEQ